LSVPLGYSSLQPEGKACTLEMSLAPPCARKFVCLYVVSEIFLMIKNEKKKKKSQKNIIHTTTPFTTRKKSQTKANFMFNVYKYLILIHR